MHPLGLLAAALLAAAPAVAAEYPYVAPGEADRLRCETPAGWQRPDFDATAWIEPPLPDGGARAAPDAGPPDGGVPVCEQLRLRRRFDVGPEADKLATLTLRARYQDGLVAWLNGVEIARRRYVSGPLATETHGPEPERFVFRPAPGLLKPTGNILTVEIHSGRAGRPPAGDVELGGADSVRILRGPYVQNLLDGAGWIRLETDLPARVSLRYGPAGKPGEDKDLREVEERAPATVHALRLTKLAAATAYRYQITATTDGVGAAAVDASFHTPPTAGHPLRVAVFGDVRSGHDIHDAIAHAIAAEDPDLALVTGDLVDRGTDEGDWERYFEIAAPLLRQVAIYPAPGNHEYSRRGKGLDRFLALFPRPAPSPDAPATSWWSFNIAGIHFVALDSEAFHKPEQLAWLEQDLKAARAKKVRAIITFDHDGPWSSGMHGDNALAVKVVAPLLERYKVTLAFSGHDHHYERGKVGNVDYLVTGGGGAELRIPRCTLPTPETPIPKRKCLPRVKAFVNEHHYVMLEFLKDRLKICPKRPDGTLLEECPTILYKR